MTASPAATTPPAPATSDQVLEALMADRHSCRAFLPDPVPRPIIERIATLAQRGASWCNAQPWQVTIVSGASADRFREAMLAAATSGQPSSADFGWPQGYPGVLGERRRACGFALYDSLGIARGDREASGRQMLENFRLFGAPHVAIVTSDPALDVYGAIDCGGYVANFLIAAQSLGVATIAQAALASWPDVVRSCLDLPAERRVICGISFGYKDPGHPANGFRTGRAGLDEVLDWRD